MSSSDLDDLLTQVSFKASYEEAKLEMEKEKAEHEIHIKLHEKMMKEEWDRILKAYRKEKRMEKLRNTEIYKDLTETDIDEQT